MKRLLVSFSGGQTSGYMAKVIKEAYEDRYDEVIYVFGNTGEEDERCLRFVDRCDREFALGVVWVEAVVHHGSRKGTEHRVVTFDTASRHGEPYEAHIQKYGIPNMAFPHCTRELKYRPIHSYAASLCSTKLILFPLNFTFSFSKTTNSPSCVSLSLKYMPS